MNITTKAINVLRKSTWIAWIENIALLLIIALTFYTLQPIETEKKIIISQNSTVKSIISQLHKKGYNLGLIDSYVLKKLGKTTQGEVKFKDTSLNRVDFLYHLTQAKIPLYKITLIPGESKENFFKNIAQKLDINASKILDAYMALSPYPEAGIAAETYLVPKKMNETKLIQFLLKTSKTIYKKQAMKYFETYNTSTWHRILIIASIIQKEAANTQEMPKIASVIYNRLKKNMRLQMDGTLNYGKYAHIKVTPQRIKTDESSFNTYKHRGLPSSAIGAVGPEAIHAALYPSHTDYLYFMRNKHGVHDFTNSYKKHRNNIQKVR